jgi:hypothetical protein
MKHNDIEDLPKINAENMENIFNVYQDEDGMYFYNLLQTITFPPNLPLNLFTPYTIGPQESWPLIAYKTLKNTGLWWMICLVNNIQNPVTPPIAGQVLKIPKSMLAREILTQMVQ